MATPLISGLAASRAASRMRPCSPRAPARGALRSVPALLVMMLHDLGKLPPIPNEPRPGVLGFRLPTLADMESVKWLASWSGPRTDEHGFRQVAGLASYRDYYQMHDSSDVRELCALRGSRRACVELTKWLRDDAESHESAASRRV